MRAFLLLFVALAGFGGAAVSIVGCSDDSAPAATSSAGGDSGAAMSPEASSGGKDATAPNANDESDASAADASAADAGDASHAKDSGALIGDGGMCNAVAQQAPADVDVITSTAPPPAALGGTIVDGTYVLTAATQHNAAGSNGEVAGSFAKITREIAGNVVQSVRTSSVQVKQATETVAVSGASIVLTAVCAFPAAIPSSLPTTFTATATSLTLYQDLSGGVVVEQVYTKL